MFLLHSPLHIYDLFIVIECAVLWLSGFDDRYFL